MRKVRKIQAKRKACFTNKKGKKQCYILKVARKYRANPEDDLEKEYLISRISKLSNNIADHLKNFTLKNSEAMLLLNYKYFDIKELEKFYSDLESFQRKLLQVLEII